MGGIVMERKFKCKDEVIVRLKETGSSWFYGVVSHADDASVVLSGGFRHPYERYDILPFYGNEHLVGTTNEPEEEIILAKGEFILLSESAINIQKGIGTVLNYSEIVGSAIIATNGNGYSYGIPMSKYNPDNLEETRKWILMVNGGKLIKANFSVNFK